MEVRAPGVQERTSTTDSHQVMQASVWGLYTREPGRTLRDDSDFADYTCPGTVSYSGDLINYNLQIIIFNVTENADSYIYYEMGTCKLRTCVN
jgi:hypothetical protein